MNCQDTADLLDSHALDRPTENQRKLVEAHFATCVACEDSWNAQQLLLTQVIPEPRPDLMAEILRHITGRNEERMRPRNRLRAAAVGGAIAVGTLFAAVTWIPQLEVRTDEAGAPRYMGAGAAVSSPTEFVTRVEQELRAEVFNELRPASVLPDGGYFALLKVGPPYPRDALEQGLEGHVVVEFTITSLGTVADVTVVESSDSIFEAAAIEGASSFKYKPRVAAGTPVDVPGVRNRIGFALSNDRSAEEPDDRPEIPPSRPAFRQAIEPAVACIDENNFQCAQLVLDETIATYELNVSEAHMLWRLYGYTHFRNQNFEQAISAYETAAAQPGLRELGVRLTLAHLYYERQQYQKALDTVVEYLVMAENTPTASVYVFVDRLRQLGASVPR